MRLRELVSRRQKDERCSLIILSDDAKVLNGVLIPDKKQLKRWTKKNHPEYYNECLANGEFDE